MIKYNLLLCLASLITFKNVSGDELYKNADDLDRTTIEQTGCKFVALAHGETKLFTKSDTSHIDMGVLRADSPILYMDHTFELNFAIRAQEDVEVLLFTKKQYFNYSATEADVKITFGSNGNQFTKFEVETFKDRNEDGVRDKNYEQRYTPDILSSDKYVNLFANGYDNVFRFGAKCDPIPIYRSKFRVYVYEIYNDIVQFGFMAKSSSGAKILYDCPANYAGCKCKPNLDRLINGNSQK